MVKRALSLFKFAHRPKNLFPGATSQANSVLIYRPSTDRRILNYKNDPPQKMLVFRDRLLIPLVDPLTSILAVLARSCQILTTSWQPWIPWQDSY